MPAMTPFGWFHTGIAILAVLVGIYVLVAHKIVQYRQPSGRLYLILTALSALTALGIYKHGGFGVAHVLAVLTLIAIAIGLAAERRNVFGRFTTFIGTAAYSGTFLFNMLPAITETLLRFPGGPYIDSLNDPLLQGFHLAFLVTYVIGLWLQLRWLRKQNP